MLARQKSVGEHPSLPAGSLDMPVEVVDKLKSRQGVAVDASVARTSKTQLYHRLSKHLYQMNLPHNVRAYVAGHCVDVSFPGACMCMGVCAVCVWKPWAPLCGCL